MTSNVANNHSQFTADPLQVDASQPVPNNHPSLDARYSSFPTPSNYASTAFNPDNAPHANINNIHHNSTPYQNSPSKFRPSSTQQNTSNQNSPSKFGPSSAQQNTSRWNAAWRHRSNPHDLGNGHTHTKVNNPYAKPSTNVHPSSSVHPNHQHQQAPPTPLPH